MEDETVIESLSGSLPITAGLTLLASVAVTPLAALLPVLSGTLAYGRQKTRIEKAIREVQSDLLECGERINDIEDGQYKVINETILTILQTADEFKLSYLRNVIISFSVLLATHFFRAKYFDIYILTTLLTLIS